MATSGLKDTALRLLGAYHDLSGGKLREPIPLGGPETPGEGAAPMAGLDPDSTECAVAVRYLVNMGYLEATGAGQGYAITVAGSDKAREMSGMSDPDASQERSRMSDQTQKRLMTVLSIAISLVLSQPLTRFIGEQIPERRGIRDDVSEAVLKGLVRMVALVVASVVVRKLAASRR
ncbi:MAG: hypothetical protein ACRDTR_10325 [Rubrobacter sp.]